MRTETMLWVDGDRVELAAPVYLRLELCATGFAVCKVRGDLTSAEGRPARLRARLSTRKGRGDSYTLLDGAVAEARRNSSGTTRLVIRDHTAALDAPAKLFLRHPTPGETLSAIGAAAGLAVSAPAAGEGTEYMSQLLPAFCEPGTLRQALGQIGQAWGITGAVWQQIPGEAGEKKVFWGPWADSPWAGAVIPIPEMAIRNRDPEAMSFEMAQLPAIRPGVIVAVDSMPAIVHRVEWEAGLMRISWRDASRIGELSPAAQLPRLQSRLGRVVA
ncbi:MAG: hypothetical protein OEZ59_13900, partial [Deltaproteobacteria bacterium]|nr:hypothetical protein [Deltaproteobacteria bacterium]